MPYSHAESEAFFAKLGYIYARREKGEQFRPRQIESELEAAIIEAQRSEEESRRTGIWASFLYVLMWIVALCVGVLCHSARGSGKRSGGRCRTVAGCCL